MPRIFLRAGVRIHSFLGPGARDDSACDLRTSASLTPVVVGSGLSQPGRYRSQAWKAARGSGLIRNS